MLVLSVVVLSVVVLSVVVLSVVVLSVVVLSVVVLSVVVLSVVVLFAANMSVIIMSLEFGKRPTKKFKKCCSSVALYRYKQAFHPPLVRWRYMSSGYCTKLDTERCSIISRVDAPMCTMVDMEMFPMMEFF